MPELTTTFTIPTNSENIDFPINYTPDSDLVYVSPGANTISDAVDAASDGATIFLWGGSYTQTVGISVSGKNLTFVPYGIVTIDCSGITDVGIPSLQFLYSASLVLGDVGSYIQIGTDAEGSGGPGYGVYSVGQVSPTMYTKLNFVRVTHNNPTGLYAAIKTENDVTSPYSTLACYDCQTIDAGQDGFSITGVSGENALLICERCTSIRPGEDGFTAHQNSTVYTIDCEAYGGKTGFAPGFGCNWTSTNDYLHDNNTVGRQANLYLAGGPNFSSTGLRLGGTTLYHMYLLTYSTANSLSTFTNMVVDGAATGWLCFNSTNAAGTQEVNFNTCSFAGTISGNGFDDVGAPTTTPIELTFTNCTISMPDDGTTKVNNYVIVSRLGKKTAWTFDTSVIKTGRRGTSGAFCYGNIGFTNCRISAFTNSGVGVNGPAYNSRSSYNQIGAYRKYAGGAVKQLGDT